MNRGATAAVVIGVVGVTASALFFLTPSTGPDLDALQAERPAVDATPVVAATRAPTPASPRPTTRGVRPPGLSPMVRGDLPASERGGPLALERGPGRMRGANAVRDRYTEDGHERILERIQGIADEQDWTPETLHSVESILVESQEQGREVLKRALANGTPDRALVAQAINEVRAQEMEALEEVLGPDADGVARKAGLMGRRAMVKRPDGSSMPMRRKE